MRDIPAPEAPAMNLKGIRRVRRTLTLGAALTLSLAPAVACSQSKQSGHGTHAGHGGSAQTPSTRPPADSPAAQAGAPASHEHHEGAMVGTVDASMSNHGAHHHGGTNEALHLE